MEQAAAKLRVGKKVWAEWTENVFYKGTVKSITRNNIRVLFDDGGNYTYKASKIPFSESIVVDSIIREDQIHKIEEGDFLLVQIQDSEAMQKGIVDSVGNVFFTVTLLADQVMKRVRKRNTGLRLFKKDETTEVKVKKELDDSVEIIKVTFKDTDPYGTFEDDGLPDLLSPEVLWHRQDLIDFSSPSENNIFCSPTFTPLHHTTIGLSMDPLASTAEAVQQTSTPVTPNNSATMPLFASMNAEI